MKRKLSPTMDSVLLISRDSVAAAVVRSEATALGIQVDHQPEARLPVSGPWSVLCLDSTADAGNAHQIRAWLQAVPQATVWWLTETPRNLDAEQAWSEGAGAVLAKPLWPPEVRAQLRRSIAANTGSASQELTPNPTTQRETTGHLQLLLDLQRELIPLQSPQRIIEHMHRGLERLFPAAHSEVTLYGKGSGPRPRKKLTPNRPEAWTKLVLPLRGAGGPLGVLRLEAKKNHLLNRQELEMVETFAYQTAQGLQRALLYQALSRGKAEWERTFDTIPDTIAIIDPDLRVRRVNRAFADSVGQTPREVVDRQCHETVCVNGSTCSGCPVTLAFNTGQPLTWEDPVVCKGRVYERGAYPLKISSETTEAVIVYGRDVTVERQLTQSLRHSEKLVTLGQIAAGIAHEINNPLTAVSSYAQLLGMRSQDPRAAESSLRIQQGIERIHRLVQNLMSFARPADDTFYPLDLNEMVGKTLSFSRYEITRHETQLVEELQPQLPKVLGSEPQLEQLLMNLLTNARDAVGGRGTIRVKTWADETRVHMEVHDDGIGIEKAELDKIFEPFYTTKPVGKGTGLGLFITAGITEKHKGALVVDSHPGGGTCAKLSLPIFSP